MKRIRKGSQVQAARDITWADLLAHAAPSTISDKALILAGTPGKVMEHDKDLGAYDVDFSVGGNWWVEQGCITK